MAASYPKGPIVETIIISEIMKTYRNRRMEPSIFYHRNSKNEEIDFVMVRDGKISLIECKSGVNVENTDTRSMANFSTAFRKTESCIICLTEKPYPVNEVTYALPLSSI